MEKRSISVMLIAIVVALAGLLAIQSVWMRETVRLREEQFEQQMRLALLRVSDRVEGMERMRELKGDRRGRRMLARLDSLRASARRDPALATLVEGEFADLDAPGLTPAPLESDREHYEAMIADLVRGILASDQARDIRKRIDPIALDSLVQQELAGLGLDGHANWAVFTAKGDPVDGLAMPDSAVAGLGESPFRTRLFRHDLTGAEHYLHVHALLSRSTLLRGSWPMLLVSGLFAAMIITAFVFTIRTVLRQKRLNDIRKDLVNNLTHELKTPISTIGLACEALADPSIPRTEEQLQSYTAMIRDENKRLGALVENVLQSAIEDDGRMVMKLVDLDLHAVISEVARSSAMQVSRRDGRIETDLAAELHRVKADRIHMTNLLYNLIDNAVKYCDKEPRVRIATSSNDEGITVSVSDNGIGVPASEQRKIFDRLYRVPTGNLHNAKGFGLGLSYVKSVVERHRGRIRLESAVGKGSTFHIFIPFQT
ncbi:MAG: HAMP domain-containing histidine kinase [Flavobacteriales bacterium]|nr:HAMP domain-containing histidine kinase [Flavobacteriales bacterium]